MDKKTNRQIGRIILNGGTINELRKAFPEFPKKPTKESFMELGYKESTAKKYICILTKNSEQPAVQEKESETLEENDLVDESPLLTNFIVTENADYKNLLIDTCAFLHDATCHLIDLADHVTFIDSIWSEMDRKKSNNSNNPKLAANIRDFQRKSVHDREKYMLSTFSGMHNEKYPDNTLLQYMMILPRQIRPTLITADYNLSNEAFNWGLESILYIPENSYNPSVCKETTIKKLKFGISLILTNSGNYVVSYKGAYPLYVIREGKEITVNNMTSVFPGEVLILKESRKGEVIEHRFEI